MTHHWGYVGAITAALLFGISATLNKIVLNETHPLIVAVLIFLIAVIVLFFIRLSPLNKKILSLFKTPTKTEKTISGKDYGVLALVILFGSVIAPFLFMHGLNETTAVNTSLLLNTESLFTVVIAVAFLGERAVKKDYAAVALIITGAVFVATSGDFQKLELTKGIFGSIFVVGACLFWGLDNNLSKIISKKRDLILITALKCFVGGAALLAISLFAGIGFSVPVMKLPYLLTVGAFGIGFSILLFLFALREIGAMKTGVIYSTSSFIGAVFAFFILNEPFTVVQMAAGIVMLYGVYLLYKK
jgi:drug/metabolite transporter (DMT)-like permease